MVEIKKIIKRDSRTESFKPEKIKLSIKASFDCADMNTTDEEVASLSKLAIDWLCNTYNIDTVTSTQVSVAVASVLPLPAREKYLKANSLYSNKILEQLDKAYDNSRGKYTDRLNESALAFKRFGFIAMKEADFWKRMAYKMAESADSLFKAMQREHEHFLAFKFEMDSMEKELKIPHKTPTEIFDQWEDQKEKTRKKLREEEKANNYYVLMDKGKNEYLIGEATTVMRIEDAKKFSTLTEAQLMGSTYLRKAPSYQHYAVTVQIFKVYAPKGKPRKWTEWGTIQ